MSYSKKNLQDAKNKLREENPSFFRGNSSRKKQVKKIIKNTQTPRKKIVKWNYKVNDVVRSTLSEEIGLIVSDNTYFGAKVEKNYYFVLFGCKVMKYDGSYLRVI
tara:strand:- start:684 stop:998 length:315 start_codon:yes stop_codon:yes gene_type:complete